MRLLFSIRCSAGIRRWPSRAIAQAGKARYTTEVKPILTLVPKLPLPLAMVVGKAMEFDPDKRYQTPSDMLIDLKLAIKRVKTAAEGGKVAGAELESSEGHDATGQPRKLMIVESDVKMQDTLREQFKRNGYRVLVSADPNRVLSRFFDDSQAADLILFTTSNNGRTALEVFNRFGQESPDARHASRFAAGPGAQRLGRGSDGGRSPRSGQDADQDARAARAAAGSQHKESLVASAHPAASRLSCVPG